MANDNEKKTSLAVAALCNGTVIDHIPSEHLFTAVNLLGLDKMQTAITIGNNLTSAKLQTKGIIKVSDVEFKEAELNRIALIAPKAKVNVIRDYEVVEKHEVTLPEVLIDIVKCANPKCISNNEPMKSRFDVVDRHDVTIKCHYCGQVVKSNKAIIK